ncbi:MAG: hypothetical protein HeimC3_13630 [Candidatus Heimdallarchaeota archaeon LC_3]|nr:MAG: hypothetical protein HeimC3_13630 [Candidatus Heimdallarchaeota archaeon LC_3]
MTDLLVEASQFLSGLYTGFMTDLLGDIITGIFTIIFLKIIIEIVFSIFPFLRRIANTIFMPFTILHQWSHIHKAKQINNKAIKKRIALVDAENIPGHERFLQSKIFVRPTFRMGIGDKENTGIIILPSEELTLKETMGLIYAPSKYGFFFTGMLIFLAPLVQANQIFGLLHLYFLFGSLLFLFPSQEDYRFIINTLMTSSTVSPMYFLWGILVFVISSYSQISFYDTLGFPPYWYVDVMRIALSATMIYYLGLLTIIGFVGPDVTLKTQRDTFWLTDQTRQWKRKQQDQLMHTSQQRQNEQLLATILTDEEEIY